MQPHITTEPIDNIEKELIKAVSDSQTRFTPLALEKMLFEKFAMGKKQAQSVLKHLVSKGELAYTYRYGCTFLELSFSKPVRISEHIVLTPPGIPYDSDPETVVIEIMSGASFGTGRHPTTRLALKGIEYAVKKSGDFLHKKGTNLLDIGTGSGVLAIAAVRLGIEKGIGIDIEPCAVAEAKENVRINGLEDKILIHNVPVEEIRSFFSLVIANLRYPTIARLFSHITAVTEPGAWVVLSGIKADEISQLLDIYTEEYFTSEWKAVEKDWAGRSTSQHSKTGLSILSRAVLHLSTVKRV